MNEKGVVQIYDPAQPGLSDEEIDRATAKARDDLLDFIYENGVSSEGVQLFIRRIARAALFERK